MKGSIRFEFSKKELRGFDAVCKASVHNVGIGTKRATEAAAKEIMDESKEQVPKVTNTLVASAFHEVHRRGQSYEAILGYGGNGDPINPNTGLPASSYMLAVHEDLDAVHPVGKAKYFEDPFRAYIVEKFPDTVIKNVKESLVGMSD